ncbi:glutathione S-transferase family protein [Thalassotalea fusca]
MTNQSPILFHAPQSRSLSVLILLKELNIEFDLHVLNIHKQENLKPEFLAVNPLGKVPTLQHHEAIVTEQAAIYMYIADLYSLGNLAPAIDDPLRGPYVRWLTFYSGCFEPALCDKGQNREPGPRNMNPYGEFDAVIGAVQAQLEQGPFLLGDRFTAADLLWGTALWWCTSFGLVESTPAIKRYIEQIVHRPSFVEANNIDADLVAKQETEQEKAVNA